MGAIETFGRYEIRHVPGGFGIRDTDARDPGAFAWVTIEGWGTYHAAWNHVRHLARFALRRQSYRGQWY